MRIDWSNVLAAAIADLIGLPLGLAIGATLYSLAVGNPPFHWVADLKEALKVLGLL